MEITAQMVKDLRAATGAGVMDCRKALEATDGDTVMATEVLKEKALASAAKKVDRETHEGLIGSYVHMGSKVAALVEVNCESDFVALTEEFQVLCKDLAMQVVATRPTWVSIEDVPADEVARLRAEFRAETPAGKPEAVVEKIVEGKLAKFYEENCLLEQPFIKDDGARVRDLIKGKVGKLGENIVVRRFARLEIGG